MTSSSALGTAPSGWPDIPAAASPGASGSAAPKTAGSSRTSCSSRSLRAGAIASIWPARNCCGLGLRLDRELDRHARYRQLPVRAASSTAETLGRDSDRPMQPTSPATARNWQPTARRTGRQPQRLLEGICAATTSALSLYPFAWVSHHWQQAVAVFADLERFPQRQVFSLRHLPDDLVGFQDAAEFDFLHSRFRSGAKRRSRSQRKPVLVPA